MNMSAKATFGPVDDGFTPKDEEKEGGEKRSDTDVDRFIINISCFFQ